MDHGSICFFTARRAAALSRAGEKIKKADRLRNRLFGGGWWIRTTEGIASRFTVCPLWPLGKSPMSCYEIGAGGRIRTPDLLITNQLLYQLSYTSTKTSEHYATTAKGICQQKYAEES